MAFDPQLAAAISSTFRQACSRKMTSAQRLDFEKMLQIQLGIKNLRNVQLWTRPGVQTRNFINRNLGQYEMDLRLFIADKIIQSTVPNFPVKEKPFRLPTTNKLAQEVFIYFNDSYIRAYTTRLYYSGNFFIIEYAADSDSETENIDLDSPEFEDLVEA